MANLILPDSNIYITALRTGRDPFKQFLKDLDKREFAICGMVMLEVCRGLRELALLRRITERFSAMIFLPTNTTTWERATQLAWSLDRQGIVLPAQDLVIAACALQANAAVLTADAHFRSIPGLTVLPQLD